MSTQPNTTDLDRLEALAKEMRDLRMFHNGHFDSVRQVAKGALELIALARRSQPVAATQQAAEPVAKVSPAELRDIQSGLMAVPVRSNNWRDDQTIPLYLATQQAAREQQEPVAFMYQDDADVEAPGTGSCVVTKSRNRFYRNETPLYADPVAQQSEPFGYIYGDEFYQVGNPDLSDHIRAEGRKVYAAPVAQQSEAGAQDAARYRFLREHWVSFSAAPPLSNLHWKGDKLDAKVDAAILEGGAHG